MNHTGQEFHYLAISTESTYLSAAARDLLFPERRLKPFLGYPILLRLLPIPTHFKWLPYAEKEIANSVTTLRQEKTDRLHYQHFYGL